VVNLSVDGNSARVRWQSITFHGNGDKARIEGGVYVTTTVRERGVWKIATAHYNPQLMALMRMAGSTGAVEICRCALSSIHDGRIPIPPATGTAPATKATLAALQKRIRHAQ